MAYSVDGVLNRVIHKYKHHDIVRRDINTLMRSYTDLRPKVDSFFFNDGQSRELINLEGTIPINYKGVVFSAGTYYTVGKNTEEEKEEGNTYNIPVSIWLLETFPYNPPMAYVKPTSTMQIKSGKHVDASGRVYLPYLHDWKYPSSDVIGLVQIMAIVFGENCPVFSKAAAQHARPQYPAAGGHGGQPPYPMQGGGMPMPGVPGAAGGGRMGYPPTSYPPTSNYPGYPPSTYGGSGTSYPGYPPSTSAAPGYPPYPGSAQQQAPYPMTGGGYSSQAVTQTSTARSALQATPSISEEQIKASILSAVEDKMRRRLKEIFSQAKAEIDSLKKTQEDLNKGKSKLENMVQRLENEQLEVEKNISTLKTKNSEITEALESMENQNEFDIDEAVVPTAPLYKQLLNSFAEEQAIEDTIYYLGEALRREVIDLDVFLKQVRELSRRQFMLRALITKCRQKAGLPEVVSS